MDAAKVHRLNKLAWDILCHLREPSNGTYKVTPDTVPLAQAVEEGNILHTPMRDLLKRAIPARGRTFGTGKKRRVGMGKRFAPGSGCLEGKPKYYTADDIDNLWPDILDERDAVLESGKRLRKTRPATSEELVRAALAEWHEYDERSIGNHEAATLEELHERSDKSKPTISRVLSRRFGSYEKYVAACVQETLAGKLALWMGDFHERHIELIAAERGNRDD